VIRPIEFSRLGLHWSGHKNGYFHVGVVHGLPLQTMEIRQLRNYRDAKECGFEGCWWMQFDFAEFGITYELEAHQLIQREGDRICMVLLRSL
jgi:hypothetical protein